MPRRARNEGPVPVRPRWPSTITELAQLLGIKAHQRGTCDGHGKRKPTCGHPVSAASIQHINDILEDLNCLGTMTGADTMINRLAHLVLCRREHQYQADEKKRAWTATLSQCQPRANNRSRRQTSNDTPEASHRQPTASASRQQTHTSGHASSSSSTASTSRRTRGSPESTSSSSSDNEQTTPSERHVNVIRRRPTAVSEEHGDTRSADIPPRGQQTEQNSSRQRAQSRSSQNSQRPGSAAVSTNRESPPQTHYFHPWRRPLSVLEVNLEVKKQVAKALLSSEQQVDGFVYGFDMQAPQPLLVPAPARGTTYIKIGFSDNVQERLTTWGRTCGYVPQQRMSEPARHYPRVERLVHLQLWNERRHESTGCPRCGTRHREWFEVDLERAKRVTAMWARWANTRPYDSAGNLLPEQRDALESVDLRDERCWERFTSGRRE